MSDALVEQLNRVRKAIQYMRIWETPSEEYPVRTALENLILAIEILSEDKVTEPTKPAEGKMSKTREWMCENIMDFEECTPCLVDELEVLLDKHAAHCSQADAEMIAGLEKQNKEQLTELELWRGEHDPCPFQVRMEAAEARCKVLENAVRELVKASQNALVVLASLQRSVEWELAPSIKGAISDSLPNLTAAMARVTFLTWPLAEFGDRHV